MDSASNRGCAARRGRLDYTVFGAICRLSSVDLFTALRNRVNRRGDERGAILILTALVMLLLLFIAAFATDLGAWYRQGQAQQQAADVSSLNGVQAYDREVQAYLESFGPGYVWLDLTLVEREAGERQAMFAAVDTIVGLLETSGLVFSNTSPDSVSLATPPNVAGDMSVVVLTADDGTVVRIVRGVVELASGELVSTISVTLTAPGDQFFSNLLRDAPQISRTGESTVSNCGAECNQPITIDPPFTGFNAGGSGDGFAPLLNGNPFAGQATQVWAVNHHANWKSGEVDNGVGEIVCRDLLTTSPCTPQSAWGLDNYFTTTWPQEVLAEDLGKIYFPATQRSTGLAGVGCFDIHEGQFCDNQFTGFWLVPHALDAAGNPQPDGFDAENLGSSHATAVYRYSTTTPTVRDEIWVLGDHGFFGCITPSADDSGGMAPCQTVTDPVTGAVSARQYPTAAVSSGTLSTEGHTGPARISWGKINPDNPQELHGFIRDRDEDVIFHCFNFETRSPCWTYQASHDAGNTADRAIGPGGFQAFNSAGAYQGVCAFSNRPTGTNDEVTCRSKTGGGLATPNNVKKSIEGIGNRFIGDTFLWRDEDGVARRMFFPGGHSDRVTCYDFVTQNTCAERTDGWLNVVDTLPTVGRDTDNNGKFVEPYGLVALTRECLLGLGDESVFFTISAENLTGCTDSITSTVIEPCRCTGSGTPNWAAIQLPVDLLSSVDGIEATVRDATFRPSDPANVDKFVTDAAGNYVFDAAGEPIYINGEGPLVASVIGNIDDLQVGTPLDGSTSTNGFINLQGIPSSVEAIELQLKVQNKFVPGTNNPVFGGPATFDLTVVSQPTLTN